jgi:hypothetical protein
MLLRDSCTIILTSFEYFRYSTYMKKLLCLLPLLVVSAFAQVDPGDPPVDPVALTVYENDFSANGPQPNFDTALLSSNKVAGQYLGKFTGATRQFATLTLTNLPPHQFVTVSFDVLVAMTWDGNGRGYLNTNDLPAYIPDNGPDIFKVTADDRTMVHTTFASHDLEFYRLQSYPGTYPQDNYRPGTGAVCTNCCGADWTLDWYWTTFPNAVKLPDSILLKDAKYHFDITYTNETDTTVVVFKTFNLSSGTFQGDWDEWWGLDNVVVQVSDAPITPLTVCEPLVVQTILASGSKNAKVYVVGEAGTDLKIQSSVDIGTWVDQRVVSFNGFYQNTVSTTTIDPSPVVAPMKLWRAIQSKKKP